MLIQRSDPNHRWIWTNTLSKQICPFFFQWGEMWEFNENIISRVVIIQDKTIHERCSSKEVGRIMGAFEPRHLKADISFFF